MKKLFIFTILILSGLVANISAQTANEKKMAPFAVGMAVSVLGEMYDEQHQNALSDFKDLPAYSTELKPLADLKKDESSYKRMDVGISVTKAIRAKANKTDKWLMLVGERFGTIYVQFKKNKVDDEEINADDLKFSLETIGILATNPPSDVPENIVKKFKELGKLKDLTNITSEQNTKKITDKVLEILSEIME